MPVSATEHHRMAAIEIQIQTDNKLIQTSKHTNKYKQKEKMTASACWHVAATERGNPLMVEFFTDLCF